MKLCKDCRYAKRRLFDWVRRCHHPELLSPTINPVTGRVKINPRSCEWQRWERGDCGIQARFFTSKDQVEFVAQRLKGEV